MANPWVELAGKLTQLGLPLLGRAVGSAFLGAPGGAIGEGAGNVLSAALAAALGLPVTKATPEAISDAIDNNETTRVVANLKALETEVAARWPALAQIEGAERTSEVEIAKINAEANATMREADIREHVATNGFWQSLYRPIMMWGAAGNLLAFGGVFFWALLADPPLWQRLVDGYVVATWWIGTSGTVLGLHFFTRGMERKAAVQQPIVKTTTDSD